MLSICIVATISFMSCSSDDDDDENNDAGDGCQICEAYQVQGNTIPQQDVCEDEDGTAIVNGIDTDVDFSEYIQALEFVTDCD